MVLQCSLCVVYWNHIDDYVCCGVSWLFLFGCEHHSKWSTKNSFSHIRLLTNTITERICICTVKDMQNITSVPEAATICSRPPQVDLWPFYLKVVSESHATCANSVPILVFLCLSVLDLGLMYATARQTDVRSASSLNTSALWGGA